MRITDEEVTFTWKDYADGHRQREMTLPGEEFLRRFLLHVLPDRFVRIRYYGLFANRHRQEMVALCKEVLPGPPAKAKPEAGTWEQRLENLTGVDIVVCPVCGKRSMRLSQEISPTRRDRERAPPKS